MKFPWRLRIKMVELEKPKIILYSADPNNEQNNQIVSLDDISSISYEGMEVEFVVQRIKGIIPFFESFANLSFDVGESMSFYRHETNVLAAKRSFYRVTKSFICLPTKVEIYGEAKSGNLEHVVKFLNGQGFREYKNSLAMEINK